MIFYFTGALLQTILLYKGLPTKDDFTARNTVLQRIFYAGAPYFRRLFMLRDDFFLLCVRAFAHYQRQFFIPLEQWHSTRDGFLCLERPTAENIFCLGHPTAPWRHTREDFFCQRQVFTPLAPWGPTRGDFLYLGCPTTEDISAQSALQQTIFLHDF